MVMVAFVNVVVVVRVCADGYMVDVVVVGRPSIWAASASWWRR